MDSTIHETRRIRRNMKVNKNYKLTMVAIDTTETRKKREINEATRWPTELRYEIADAVWAI